MPRMMIQGKRPRIGQIQRYNSTHDIARVIPNRTTLKFYDETTQMQGDGFKETIKELYNKGKAGAKFLQDAYTGEIGTALRNMVPSSDETARDGYPGERHAILKLKNGKFGVGNYMGPDTSLLNRLKRGDPPRTETDKASKAHDIRYARANTIDDIRKADQIMGRAVARIARNKMDAPININLARLVTAKTIGEDLGLIKRDAFSGDLSKNKKLPASDQKLLDGVLRPLEQAGYGKEMLPGDALKMKLLKKLTKDKMRAMHGKGMCGKGMYGKGEGKLSSFLVNNVVPSILSSVGVKKGTISTQLISSVIKKALKNSKGNIPSVVSNLTKTILPMVVHGFSKKMKGSGLIEDAKRNQKMRNPNKTKGLLDILGEKKDDIMAILGKGIFLAIKKFYPFEQRQQGSGMKKGRGQILMSGAGFWADFSKGFKSVFKPGAKILGGIASAVGMPEVGIPLGLLSDSL